ncbi:MAG: hypothetical protein KF696_06095 [Planctomycetes bacterium]|nr:hypothetical protein [Planctomycetota bacterium]MCW8136458.1 hypothetical protein [Planctomycetota bacterium]
MTLARFFFCLLLAALALPALAQDFTAYTAHVTGESVRLRSGPSLAHPPVHVMAKGEALTVVAEQDGWAIVRLPAAAPCWLSADFVKSNANTYVVTADKVNLRVTPDTKYFSVGQVDKDAVLKAVMGEDGKPATENGFVRVVPPASALGAVSLEFIERAKVEAKAEPKPEGEVAKPEEPKPLVKKEQVKRDPTAKELEDERKTFTELERLLNDELKKPAADISLAYIRKMFEQFVELALDKEVSAKSQAYIEKIDATEKLILAEKERLEKEAAARAAEIERIKKEAEQIGEKPKEEPKGPVEYIAIGTVGSHGKTAKTPASHRLFDESGKTLVDLRWDGGDLSKLMGSRVGIVGEVKEYKGWPHKVIVIKRIDVLEEGEEK